MRLTISLLILCSALPLFASSVDVCLTDSFSDKGCRSHKIDCNFSEKEIKLIKMYDEDSAVSINKASSHKGRGYLAIYPGDFDSINSQSDSLFTKSLYTCSGIALINTQCGYASLMHYMQNSPSNTVKSLIRDYKDSCQDQSPQAIFMLSAVESYFQSLEMPIYRKMICDLNSEMPSAKITVFFSEKKRSESDAMYINLQIDKAEIRLERFVKNKSKQKRRMIFKH